MISCSIDTNLKDVIELMLSKRIRNIIIAKENERLLVDDRKILEFLFSPYVKKIISDGKSFSDFKIESLRPETIPVIKDDITISGAAKLLTSLINPIVLMENNVVSPWDVVMKTCLVMVTFNRC